MARYIVQMRRGTAEQWAQKSTLIPKEGEIVIEIDEINSLHKLKIGDGEHSYSELAYLQAGDELVTQALAEVKPRVVTVNLSTNWQQNAEGKYSQPATISGLTARSRLDLQPDADMLAEFERLGLVFVTENNGGFITVYSVGNMPIKSYTMQATIIETECAGDRVVVGATVGIPAVVQADWEQEDESAADFIKNKPTILDEDDVKEIISSSLPEIVPGTTSPSPFEFGEGDNSAVQVETGARSINENAMAIGEDTLAGSLCYEVFRSGIGYLDELTNSAIYSDTNNYDLEYDVFKIENYNESYGFKLEDKISILYYQNFDDVAEVIDIREVEENLDGTKTVEIVVAPGVKFASYYKELTYPILYIRCNKRPAEVGNIALEANQFAGGSNSKALMDGAFSFGRNNTSAGKFSTTFGTDCEANYGGFAAGRQGKAYGQCSTVLNSYCTANANNSTAIGVHTETRKDAINSIAAGHYTIAADKEQVVIGRCNVPVKNRALIVGIGEYNEKTKTREEKNGLELDWNGNLDISGNVEVDGHITTAYATENNHVIHKGYVDAVGGTNGYSEGLAISTTVVNGATIGRVQHLGSCTDSHLIIPPVYQGYPVTIIWGTAFDKNTRKDVVLQIKSVDVPSSVTEIRAQAFRGCSNLTELKLHKGLKVISNQAFQACSGLESVYIPEGVNTIGSAAFANCTNLREINIPQSVTQISSGSFSSCPNVKIYVQITREEAIEIDANRVENGEAKMWDTYLTDSRVVWGSEMDISTPTTQYVDAYVDNKIENICVSSITGVAKGWVFGKVFRTGSSVIGDVMWIYGVTDPLVLNNVASGQQYRIGKLESKFLPRQTTGVSAVAETTDHSLISCNVEISAYDGILYLRVNDALRDASIVRMYVSISHEA